MGWHPCGWPNSAHLLDVSWTAGRSRGGKAGGEQAEALGEEPALLWHHRGQPGAVQHCQQGR